MRKLYQLLFVLIMITTTNLNASDWIMYSSSSYQGQTVVMFFERNIKVESNGFQYWAKMIDQRKLFAKTKHPPKSFLDSLTAKINSGYIPPVLNTSRLRNLGITSQAKLLEVKVQFAGWEMLASENEIVPDFLILWEIDQDTGMRRALKFSSNAKGKHTEKTYDDPKWDYMEPGNDEEIIAEIIKNEHLSHS